MKKSFLMGVFCMTLVFRGSWGQTPEPTKGVLPPGPLIIDQMPAFAQWTIDYTYSNTPKPGEPSALDLYKQEALKDPALAKALEDPQYVFSLQNIRPLHMVVTKTGNVLHQETTFEQNYKGEMWANRTVKVEKRPNLSELVAVIRNDLQDAAFPGFDWISKRNLAGIETKDGHKCAVFKGQVDPVAISHPGEVGSGTTVPAIAYIDSETHYPVSFQFGVETRQYTFLAPPTDELVMPDEFVAAGKAMMAQIQKATPHLGRP